MIARWRQRRAADQALQQALAQWDEAWFLETRAWQHGTIAAQISAATEDKHRAERALHMAWLASSTRGHLPWYYHFLWPSNSKSKIAPKVAGQKSPVAPINSSAPTS